MHCGTPSSESFVHMDLADKVSAYFSEASTPLNWRAEYYCVTPNGNKARFTRGGSVYQLDGGAASEWTVLAALREAHPGCRIEILNVKFSG
jgi:hypothetical protein